MYFYVNINYTLRALFSFQFWRPSTLFVGFYLCFRLITFIYLFIYSSKHNFCTPRQYLCSNTSVGIRSANFENRKQTSFTLLVLYHLHKHHRRVLKICNTNIRSAEVFVYLQIKTIGFCYCERNLTAPDKHIRCVYTNV